MNQAASVSKLAAELAGDMPKASEHLKEDAPPAPAANGPAAAPPPPATDTAKPDKKSKKGSAAAINPADYAHLKDKHGFSFDPKVHKTKKDGAPLLTAAGLLWRKPGQRPKQSKSFIYQGAPRPGEDAPPGVGTEAAHYEASGRVMAETIFSIGQMLFGQEWAPIKIEGEIDERAQMSSAWAEYSRAKGINDIPPGVAVAIAMASYSLPRLAKDNTKKKIGGFFGWIKNRKRKRTAPPPPPEKAETINQAPPPPPAAAVTVSH